MYTNRMNLNDLPRSSSNEPLDLTFSKKFDEKEKEVEIPIFAHSSQNPPPNFLPIDRHPLLNHVVIDLIFSLLDVMSLKNCRLVCVTWGETGVRWILEKGVVEIDGTNVSMITGIKNWMVSTGSVALFKNFRCDKITHGSYPNLWTILGDHVLSFHVSSWWGDHRDLTLADYEDLLLKRCLCLEELVLPSTKRFKNGLKFLQCATAYDPPPGREGEDQKDRVKLNLLVLKVTGDVRPHLNFWRLVIISPKLKYLYMQCHLVQEFWNPFAPRPTWEKRMSALEKIEIRKYGNDSLAGHCARYFPGRPWSLKHFVYECYDLSDMVMQKGSEHLKETMETLEVVLFNKKYDPWPADLNQPWMTTPELTKLTKYKLSIDDHCEGPIFCRALVLSMFLPKLVSLIFTIFEEGQNTANWEEGLFTRIYNDYFPPLTHQADIDGNNVTMMTGQVREAMRVLVLPPNMVDTSCIQRIITIYPNIRELTLNCPSPHFLALILENWINLERLTVTLLPEEGVNWNFVLTGLQASGYSGEDNQYQVFFNGASVVNLKELKSVDITLGSGNGANPQIFYLDDTLIYYGLLYLIRLQHVRIRGHRFSPDAFQLLRTEVLPFCRFDFKD